MPTQNNDLHWLAGLLEGEAWFGVAKTRARNKVYLHPRIDLATTDEDIVRRAAKILGTHCRSRARKGNYKQVYQTIVYSTRALTWMKRLFPLLGKRRRAQIAAVIKQREAIRNKPWGKRHVGS